MFLLIKGKNNKIKIDINSAITPPNFLGIDRKIAYAKRKYHSGWICSGVTKGFAEIKLSGSVNKSLFWSVVYIKNINSHKKPTISLYEKYLWKGTIPLFLVTPTGFLDPSLWRAIRWADTINIINKGKIKCKEKKRFSVALLIEKPPHSQNTISPPK